MFLAFLCGVSLALKTWELPTERPWEHINRDLDLQWMTFKKTYNRTYEAEEELKRYLFAFYIFKYFSLQANDYMYLKPLIYFYFFFVEN